MEANNSIRLVAEELAKGDKLQATAKHEALTGKSCRKVLKELLAQITEINFRSKANLDDEARVTQKQYVVIAIDEVIDIAKANDWGLCTKDGFIYVYNGRYWQLINAEDFKSFLAEAVMKMGVPIFDAKYFKFRDDIYKQFLSSANLPTPEQQDKVLINLLNGTFEITNAGFRLREPCREDFLKYQLPFEHNPSAECPIFRKYLNRVLPDIDCQKVLAEYMGYIFVNNLKLEKALILFGTGANGKSVFFEVINAILGKDNICSYSLQSLTQYDSYQRAELANKLLNYATEISVRLDTAIFKQMVSGEPVEARRIYSSPFVMTDYAKLMFNCNELPRDIEQTDAFFRRFLIIPFTETIPEEEQDPDLSKKIISSELSGVFNWILDGLNRILNQRKFTKADIILSQIAIFRKESDSVAMFVEEEGYKPSVEETKPLKNMYGYYKDYCSRNGYRLCSNRTFSDRLRMLRYVIERKSQGMVVFCEKNNG